MSDIFDRRDRTPRGPHEPEHDTQARLRAVENRVLAIAGEDGTNGKLGNLRRDFDAERAGRGRWAMALTAIALPALITGVTGLIVAARDDGAKDRTVLYLQERVATLERSIETSSETIFSLRTELASMRAMLLATPPRPTRRQP